MRGIPGRGYVVTGAASGIGLGTCRRDLEEVAAGESIEITDRGHPVARLVPITGDPWEHLISAGEVVKAAGPMNIDDLKPAAYPHSASETLERLRTDER